MCYGYTKSMWATQEWCSGMMVRSSMSVGCAGTGEVASLRFVWKTCKMKPETLDFSTAFESCVLAKRENASRVTYEAWNINIRTGISCVARSLTRQRTQTHANCTRGLQHASPHAIMYTNPLATIVRSPGMAQSTGSQAALNHIHAVSVCVRMCVCVCVCVFKRYMISKFLVEY
jgi:hypothetical protein